ncbi:MAG: hypothetical protein P4M05_28005 [Bradyrhizobium sp.]|nr:hypothetical protein [Bradyrhizobium sp.]
MILETSALCGKLAELQVSRKFYIATATKISNAAGALVRRMLGWAKDIPEKEQAAIKARATRILKSALSGKEPHADDAAIHTALAGDLLVVVSTLEPLEKRRRAVELEMAKTARQLAVAAWAKQVRGLGDLALGIIVGEAGDLSNYASVDRLWKRLGLAPYQGKALSTWAREGGLKAEDWVAAGCSRRRRAEIFACVGDPVFRHQTMIGGPYRIVYEKRRARTSETHPDWSKLRSNLDALRIMTKALIEDLWKAWRKANVEPLQHLKAA